MVMIIFAILIYVQIILLKYHIICDISSIEEVYLIVVIASLFLLKLLNEINKLNTIKKLFILAY